MDFGEYGFGDIINNYWDGSGECSYLSRAFTKFIKAIINHPISL